MRNHGAHLATVTLASVWIAACGIAVLPPDAAPDAVVADATPPDVTAAPDAAPDAAADAPSPPDAPDVTAAPDAPAPMRCASAVPVAGGETVERADLHLGGDGVLIAWVPRGGATVAIQSFTLELEARAEPLVITVPGGVRDAFGIEFFGSDGLVAAGSSIFQVRFGEGSRLTMTGVIDVAPRVVRRAWHAGSATNIRAITGDGAMVYSNGANTTVNSPSAPLADPIGASATVLPTLGGYRAFEMRATAGGARLQMREFVTGHGVVLEARNEFGDGASASRVIAPGDGLYRLVYSGEREVDVALERRDEGAWTLAGAPTPLQRGAAWNATSGAISYGMFMAWASRPAAGGENSALNTQWDPTSPVREAFRSTTESPLEVYGAESDRFRLRAWVLFAERAPSGDRRLLARCLDR